MNCSKNAVQPVQPLWRNLGGTGRYLVDGGDILHRGRVRDVPDVRVTTCCMNCGRAAKHM